MKTVDAINKAIEDKLKKLDVIQPTGNNGFYMFGVCQNNMPDISLVLNRDQEIRDAERIGDYSKSKLQVNMSNCANIDMLLMDRVIVEIKANRDWIQDYLIECEKYDNM